MIGVWRIGRLYRKYLKWYRGLVIQWPERVQCNLCSWSGFRFASDKWHPYTVCPQCESQIRHRLLGLVLERESSTADGRMPSNPKVLHFAPETCIAGKVQALSTQYSSADFMRSDVDMQLDMSNMVGVSSGLFDLVIAIDVLEHVYDDMAALNELHRVLSPTGVLLLSVPQVEKEYAKWEDPSANTPDLRYHAYGQNDHVRLYGRLFPTLLEDSGYIVRTVEASSFSSDVQKRHVLAPPILSSHPHATNVRRLFVCTKSEYNAC